MDIVVESSATRERIIEVAERLFAEHGFEATSLRQITQQAGVNLAAVNYHFGSKEGLLKQLLVRRIVPMNLKRMEMLKSCLEEKGSPSLHKIFRAVLLPFFETGLPDGQYDLVFVRLLGRTFSEPPAYMIEIYQEHFQAMSVAFLDAIKLALPDLSSAERVWRFHFAVSLMLGSFAQRQRVAVMSDGLCDPDDVAGTVARLIDFIVAWFQSEGLAESKGGWEEARGEKV